MFDSVLNTSLQLENEKRKNLWHFDLTWKKLTNAKSTFEQVRHIVGSDYQISLSELLGHEDALLSKKFLLLVVFNREN